MLSHLGTWLFELKSHCKRSVTPDLVCFVVVRYDIHTNLITYGVGKCRSYNDFRHPHTLSYQIRKDYPEK